MHGRSLRRAGMVAGLTFGLMVALGTALPPAHTTPVARAQADATPTTDAPDADVTPTTEAPAVDGAPMTELPALDVTPTASPPAAGASPTPVSPGAPVGDAIPEPPGVVAGIVADGLKGDAVFRSGTCPTGDASGLNVGEGFQLRVRGRCVQSQDIASISVTGNGVSFADGDLALDFKVAVGAERASIRIFARNRDGKLLATHLNFKAGEATLYRRENAANMTLATVAGLGELVTPTDWNRLALRVRGGEVWLLLNDVPVLYATDALNQEGGIGLAVEREGNPDDGDEVTVVFRDLTVSRVDPAE